MKLSNLSLIVFLFIILLQGCTTATKQDKVELNSNEVIIEEPFHINLSNEVNIKNEKIVYFNQSFNLKDEYKILVSNLNELEMYLDHPDFSKFGFENYTDEFFKDSSLIIISFIWGNISKDFTFNKSEKIDNNLYLHFHVSRALAGCALARNVVVLEVSKNLTNNIQEIIQTIDLEPLK